MTSLYEAQKGLIAEVKGRILALAPEYEESIRFAARDGVSRAMAELGEDTGRARLFEIGEAQYSEPTYFGCSARAFRYIHQIEIMYPNDEIWSMGMISDAELIRYDLINNSTAASGVQQRHLDPTAAIEIQTDTDDPWKKISLDLVVYYEVS